MRRPWLAALLAAIAAIAAPAPAGASKDAACDGRNLAMEGEKSGRWEQAYDPAVDGKGNTPAGSDLGGRVNNRAAACNRRCDAARCVGVFQACAES